MEIDYKKFLDDWAEKIYKEADKYDKDREYEPSGTYKDGLYKGWQEGLISAVTMLTRMERELKAAQKLKEQQTSYNCMHDFDGLEPL